MADNTTSSVACRPAAFAATADYSPLSQVLSHGDRRVATLTVAYPTGTPVDSVVIPNDVQPAKSPACHVGAVGSASRLRYRFGKRLTASNTATYALVWHASILTSLCQCYGASPVDHAVISASIARLFATSSPAAITRFVIAIRVDAVECGATRTFAHVTNKCGEVSPFITDRNAPATVASPVRGSGVTATVEHGLPRSVCWGVVVSVPGYRVNMEATTGSRSALPQIRSTDCCNCAAFTLAEPARFAAKVVTTRKHSQSSKLCTRQVEKSRHLSILCA